MSVGVILRGKVNIAPFIHQKRKRLQGVMLRMYVRMYVYLFQNSQYNFDNMFTTTV